MAYLPRVAIIGRANVGKSSLFNRFTSGAKALVSEQSGTTRDRKEGTCVWTGKQFVLIDTGGLDINPNEHIEKKIAEQAITAAQSSDLILFVLDINDGITPADQEISRIMRRTSKPIILVANKADSGKQRYKLSNLETLGLGSAWPISAANGNGSGDLLDEIVSRIPAKPFQESKSISVAIIGKPNVGKSSLINALVAEERSIVHDQPYTTRDANEVHLTFHGKSIMFLDTAGVRRRSKIQKQSIESVSAHASLAAITHADVVLLVTESHVPLTGQDLQLARLIDESQASIVVVGNKWDLVKDKDAKKAKEFEEYYQKELNFISWAPVILMSATEKTKLTKLLQAIMNAYDERFREVTENALSKFLKTAVKRQKPTIGWGTKKPFIYRIKQVGTNPPQFVVIVEAKSTLKYTYLNFLERMLREKFGFTGSPIKMWVKKSSEPKK